MIKWTARALALLTLCAFGVAMAYGVGAFIAFDANPAVWTKDTRGILVVLAAMWTMFWVIVALSAWSDE